MNVVSVLQQPSAKNLYRNQGVNYLGLFGSYARGEATTNSDIDLLCVTNRKKVREVAQTFKTRYNLNIQVVVVKISDFKNIKKDNPIFWEDLIEYGLILDGLDSFFKEVYQND